MNIFVVILGLLIKLTLLTSTSDDTEMECKKSTIVSPYKQLKTYLFCEYDPWSMSAIDDKNGTDVYIGLAPTLANFDEDDGNLEIFGWMITSWFDPQLRWNRSSFDNVGMLRVEAYEVWRPEIAVLSAGNEDTNEYSDSSQSCYILRRGRVICAPRVQHTIRCQTDFTQWPFDRQNCTLVFSTWLRSNEHIRFMDRQNDTIVMDFFQPNGDWTFTASRVFYDQRKPIANKSPGVTSPRLSIDFIVDRVHNQLSGRYVSPTILMMALTLTTLWLDPRSVERLAVACVNPVIHLLSIQSLHAILPHNGSTVPSILVFYASSLVLATIALLLTVILANVQGTKSDPPKWMSSSTAAILRTRVGQFLLLSMLDPKVAAQVEPDADDSGDLVDAKSPRTAWTYFAIMCGWLSFLSILFAYLVMYAVLVPNSSMRPPIKALGYHGLRN